MAKAKWKYADSEIINSHETNYMDKKIAFRWNGSLIEVWEVVALFVPCDDDAKTWITAAMKSADRLNDSRISFEGGEEDGKSMWIEGWRAPKVWEGKLVPGLNFK